KTLDYIAARGIKGMITLNGERIVDQIFHAYRDASARAGRTLQLGEDLCWGVGIYLADSEAEAIRQVEPAHDERYKWFAPFGFVRYADEHGRPRARRLGCRRCARASSRRRGCAGRRDRSSRPSASSKHAIQDSTR